MVTVYHPDHGRGVVDHLSRDIDGNVLALVRWAAGGCAGGYYDLAGPGWTVEGGVELVTLPVRGAFDSLPWQVGALAAFSHAHETCLPEFKPEHDRTGGAK